MKGSSTNSRQNALQCLPAMSADNVSLMPDCNWCSHRDLCCVEYPAQKFPMSEHVHDLSVYIPVKLREHGLCVQHLRSQSARPSCLVLQVINFYSNKLTPDCNAMMFSLTRMLPDSIKVLSLERVPPDFHARYSALSKTYHYYVMVGKKVDPFTRWYRGRVQEPVNLPLMR